MMKFASGQVAHMPMRSCSGTGRSESLGIQRQGSRWQIRPRRRVVHWAAGGIDGTHVIDGGDPASIQTHGVDAAGDLPHRMKCEKRVWLHRKPRGRSILVRLEEGLTAQSAVCVHSLNDSSP